MITSHETNLASALFARMGGSECERIHVATLEVLERIGVETLDKKARDILVKGGAQAEGTRVRIPEYMVRRALDTAPKRMTLYDRKGRVAIRAWGHNSYFGNGSDCLYVLDHRTGKRRQAVLQDVVEAATVLDALAEVDFVMSAFLPADIPEHVYTHYQMQAMLTNTTKPLVFVTPDFESCVANIEMLEIVAGGEKAFRERPFAVCYINVTSGLVANDDSLHKCMYFAEKGLPQLYIPLNAAGVNSPATTAGCMTTMNAGILLGVVLSQLVRPGSPIAVPGWNGGPYNLQTMVGNYCLPDEQGVAASMGKFYDLPVFGLGGSTDSKALDQQAGAECALGLMLPLLNGANIVHDIGFMDSGLQGSLPLMTIADDLLGWIRAATRGVPVTEETLALEVVEELGPEGDYLSHDHTFKHFRDPYYSKLADRQIHSAWEADGSSTMAERAAKKVDEILANHKAEPLPENIQQALENYVKKAKTEGTNAQ